MRIVVDLCQDSPPRTVVGKHSGFIQKIVTCSPKQQRSSLLHWNFRRGLMEACVFLSATCIENCVALVNRNWFDVSRDEELWKRKWLEERQPHVTPSRGSFRAAFLDLCLGSCWHCGLYINHFGVECPPLRRLLCQTCSQQSSCQILSSQAIAQQFHAQPSTLNLLRVPTFLVDNEPATYLCLAVNRLLPYYERRRNLLLLLIRRAVAKTTLRKLQTFDFGQVAEKGTGKMLALCKFCGKNEATERLDESVKELLAKLKLRCLN